MQPDPSSQPFARTDRIRHQLLHHRSSLLASFALLTVASIVVITGFSIGERVILPGLRVDNSMQVWFRSDDPDWVKYKRFQDIFEGDEFAIVCFQVDDIFVPEVLDKIQDLTKKFSNLPYVLDVTSLTNIDSFHGAGGVLTISELISEIPQDRADLARLRDHVLSHPLYRGNIISDDGRTTALVLRLANPSGGNYQREFTDRLHTLCAQESEGDRLHFHISGSTVIFGMQDRATTDDVFLLLALCCILMIAGLYLIYRRAVFVALPLAVALLTNLWIHALIPLLGSSYNMVLNILPTLVIVIAIADTVHYISDYSLRRRQGADVPAAVNLSFRMLIIPCLFMSLTTAAGFASMSVSELRPIMEFSVFSATAMLLIFVVNMVLVTLGLSFLKEGPETAITETLPMRGMAKAMNWIAALNRRHVRVNLLTAVVIFLVSITGILMIEVNIDEIKYFRKSHPVRQATEFIEEHFTGTVPLEIMLEAAPDAFKNPDLLVRMERLESFLSDRPHVRKTSSLVGYLKEIFRVLNDGDPEYHRIPDSREAVAQSLLLAEEHLGEYVDISTYATARIHARMNFADTNEIAALSRDVSREMQALFSGTGVEANIVGTISLYLNAMDYILESQIKGFSVALVVIFLMLSLLVRSFKLGLLAMVPNILPVSLTLGIMGWTGIYLDLATVLIASIAIGLAVDDTIHFLSRFRYLFDQSRCYETAIDATLLEVGPPILTTSMVLVCGFGLMVFSTFMPVVYFGVLASITILSTLIADLFVLPALIKVFKPFGPETMH